MRKDRGLSLWPLRARSADAPGARPPSLPAALPDPGAVKTSYAAGIGSDGDTGRMRRARTRPCIEGLWGLPA